MKKMSSKKKRQDYWTLLDVAPPPPRSPSYFESTWVGTSTTSPLFSHDMWNQHDASLMLIPRSSNIAEGWHHGFPSMLSCYNPTLWKFLDALKSEQALTDQKLARRKLRQLPEPRAPKWIKYDQRLQNIDQ